MLDAGALSVATATVPGTVSTNEISVLSPEPDETCPVVTEVSLTSVVPWGGLEDARHVHSAGAVDRKQRLEPARLVAVRLRDDELEAGRNRVIVVLWSVPQVLFETRTAEFEFQGSV